MGKINGEYTKIALLANMQILQRLYMYMALSVSTQKLPNVVLT